MTALITLCNEALAEIGKGQIASLTEGSIEARECARFAQPLLNEMIDWSEEIPLGRKRAVLAVVTNDRDAEWLYSYAKPADLGTPLYIREPEDAATDLPTGGPFDFPYQSGESLAFLHEGDRIYSNVETASLVYTRSSLEASELSPLMQRAFVLELAVRLAAPVAKWDERKIDAKARQAEVARQRAIAAEENKSPRRSTRYISEAEYARHGIGV